jgi:hypothetical protein
MILTLLLLPVVASKWIGIRAGQPHCLLPLDDTHSNTGDQQCMPSTVSQLVEASTTSPLSDLYVEGAPLAIITRRPAKYQDISESRGCESKWEEGLPRNKLCVRQ